MANRYMCGVPVGECKGADTQMCMGMKGHTKSHGSHEDAFACMASYLIRQGYAKIGQREFAAPNGGPVTVLTKKSKFGGLLRPGKGVKGISSKRFTPKSGKRCCGGMVISN